jgi:phenylacetate-CoA ligase
MRPGDFRVLLDNVAVGHARDWFGAARAMHAAGIAAHDIVLSGVSCLEFGAHMIQGGAERIGCAIIPAGLEDVDLQIALIERFRANAYCGKPGILRQILARAAVKGRDVSSLTKAFVFGEFMSTHFRRECEGRGLVIRQAWAAPEVGVIAYQTSGPDGGCADGKVVNEGVIVEIVDPRTGEPVRRGEAGEVVVTRPNVDFPILRMRTGELTREISGPSPCGRTNMRVEGRLGRVDELAAWRDRLLSPSQILQMRARHACCRNMKLFLLGDAKGGEAVLRVEGPKDDPHLPVNLRNTMRNVLGFEAKIEIRGEGELPRDGRLIIDQRKRA